MTQELHIGVGAMSCTSCVARACPHSRMPWRRTRAGRSSV